MDRFNPLFVNNSEPLGVVLGAIVMFAVGLADDLKKSTTHDGLAEGISAPAKVTGMVVAGAVLAYFGVTMFYFRIPFFDVVTIGQDLAPLVTVLWLIGMANAINLIDGLDGLAAGIVAIASGTFFLYGQRLDKLGLLAQPNIGPLVAIIVLGICLGFLPHNFNPARIFMGDSGALLLGLLMAASTTVVGGRADPNQPFSGQTYFFFAPLFIPLRHPRRADRRHGLRHHPPGHPALGRHHRRQGPPPPPPHARSVTVSAAACLILWSWTAILSGFVLYPAYTGEGNGVVPLGIAALGLALFTVLHPQVRRTRADSE